MWRWLLIALGLACANQAYQPTQAELVCFAQADSVATERVNSECNGHLTGCAATKDIEAQLKAALEACK